MAFTFAPLPGSPDVIRIDMTRHADDRGWFAESYKRSALEAASIRAEFRQDNHSFSRRPGTLRGLHFQIAPAAQAKLVRVTSGSVFDVAVDIRPGATFGRWVSLVLDADTPSMLWIPEGFAHGFQTLVPDTTVLYKTTAEYSPQHERGILWSDASLAIPWPIADPLLSQRDERWPSLSAAGLKA